MNTAEQKAKQEYPDPSIENEQEHWYELVLEELEWKREAYIKGYAAGQEALPLAMSEEEIEREADKWCGSEEYNRCESTTEALKVFAMRVLARSKSLTVEKGRTFTEGEVKSMLDDAEMLARIMGALVLDVDEARAMAESDISTIKVRHGISLDPA